MNDKQKARLRRAKKTRAKIALNADVKLTVGRSNQHISAQLIAIDADSHRVLGHASTMDKELRELKGSKVEQAQQVGKRIAEKAKEAGVKKIAFDRSGYKYHGRVKALADAAREGGIEF